MLDAWSASPARFREDANAEDDLVRGSYRDRVVVELAQNAADAAARAGEPGRLRLRLTERELVASNTGAPLDAAGAESLSTLRASAKRHPATPDRAPTGRFGVGFAAVLAVTDEPRLASTTGALRWSSTATRDAVVAVPALAEELARRRGQLPVLRLPLPDDRRPDDGFATTVTLPLRDDAAAELVRRLLAEVDDALLLALPDLAQIEVVIDGATRVVADAARWDVVRRSGALDPQLLLDRPVEERDRPWWSLTWARPVAGQPVPPTVHAPTPTDEPLDLPALLIASFPLDPGRRHVAPGPLTDFLVARAAEAYAELAAQADDPLDLVPAPVAAGALDGALRAAALGALVALPLLRTASGERVHPGDAVVVVGADEEVRAVLADVLPGLVADHPALGRLGVRRLPMAEVVDLLATLDREPRWWHRLYAALADRAASGLVESLGALPVPLADGRTTRGRVACCCPATAACPRASTRSGCGSCTPMPPTRCCCGWAPSRRPLPSCSTSPRCARPSRTPGTTSRRPRWLRRCSRWCSGRAPGRVSCRGSASCCCPTIGASSPPRASSCCPGRCSTASPTRRPSAARHPSCSTGGGPTCWPPRVCWPTSRCCATKTSCSTPVPTTMRTISTTRPAGCGP